MAHLRQPQKTIDEYGWESDFISLLGKRWELHNKVNVLEIGCGYGHWTKQYQTVLPNKADVTLLDISQDYLTEAKKRLTNYTTRKFFFCAAKAQNLPFQNDTFDFITCQRVLMHVKDPAEVINEMKRVLYSSGVIAILEPCSLYRSITASYREELFRDEDYGKLCYFQEVAERGKIKLGGGDNSIGESVPVILQKCGFVGIKACLSDCLVQLIPGLKSESQLLFKREIINWFKNRFYSIWDREEAKRYFIAGGGEAEEFKKFEVLINKLNKNIIRKVNQNNAHVILNEPIFITWAEKP